MRRNLKYIVDSKLCLGCGICESLGTTQGYSMYLESNGFYSVSFPNNRNKLVEKDILDICPSINLTETKSNSVWGKLESVNYAWSNNEAIRRNGSSGGVITAIATHLLEKNEVDAILHVGVSEGSTLYNGLKISRTSEEVLQNASSRYAPALVFNQIIQLLDSTSEIYSFIGKPCDIIALKKLIAKFPQYNIRIKHFISLVCAGIPSYLGTLTLLKKETGRTEMPIKIKYRGDGWPGNFTANFKDGFVYKSTYIDSYGRYLRDYTHFRCKICPDGIGLSADIVVGDAWETNNGYPDFEERPGRSFVLVRNLLGQRLIDKMDNNKSITIEKLEIEKLSQIQPYQYQRRISVGYRIYFIHLIFGFIFNLHNSNLVGLMLKYPLKKGIREVLGTAKRLNRINKFQ
jgi:coenzyme F420 hydrogenase subunit beta